MVWPILILVPTTGLDYSHCLGVDAIAQEPEVLESVEPADHGGRMDAPARSLRLHNGHEESEICSGRQERSGCNLSRERVP